MQPSIGNTYLFLGFFKEIKDTLEKTNSDVGQLAQVYEHRQLVWSMKQNNQSITVYYSNLCLLWEEIDNHAAFLALYATDALVF